jgi:hypothetical protein
MNLPQAAPFHSLQVKVRNNEIQAHTRWASAGVAVTAKHMAQRRNIFASFEGVVVVRALAQLEACGSELLEPFPITQSRATPVVTLEENDWPVKTKTLDWQKLSNPMPDFSRVVQHCLGRSDLV